MFRDLNFSTALVYLLLLVFLVQELEQPRESSATSESKTDQGPVDLSEAQQSAAALMIQVLRAALTVLVI